ncbi:hypothetical protein N7520_004577 [Penicillium odoratum]|uniref:uncharacterized protein n=1 Tax=Penicillium odoratum TaxID=1167516 RepID=UPI0025468010|nr:uncharacterized protein N7520_004577 [Penicillium odoratum]KAJ5765018.1 hypothetical protein N7520_004577 [Penicillium odoratum]
MDSSNKENKSLRKREARPGARKVSALSTEQLERKRANDREAQRSIRQRAKENTEQLQQHVAMLEAQVAGMRPRYDRYDELMQHNAALEEEVRVLREELAAFTGRPGLYKAEHVGSYRGGWPVDEVPVKTASASSSSPAIPLQFAGSSHQASDIHRAPSTLSLAASMRSLHGNNWQPYSGTRSRSLGDCSDQESSTRMEPYVIDGRLHQGSRLVPPSLPGAPHISLGSPTSASSLQMPDAPYPPVPLQSDPNQAVCAQLPQSYRPGPSLQSPSTQNTPRDQTFVYHPWTSES